MEISKLHVLLNDISSFFQLSSFEDKNPEPVLKYYQNAKEILKLLKPILDAIINTSIASDELLTSEIEELGQTVGELKDLFSNWQPLLSKVYFVLQIESLLSKVRTSALDIFDSMRLSHEQLSDGLSSASLEHCVQKIKHFGHERTSSAVRGAAKDQMEGVGPSSEVLANIAETLGLMSTQDILIEAVALEKVKEDAEQEENTEEFGYIDYLLTLVTGMYDRLVMIKQSQSCSPVQIPADFCCPLSLELMADPVIVASGQTYERAYIKNWLDLGIIICPKTRQALAHVNLIPNYTVKQLIVNWCESNSVKLPDPRNYLSLNQPPPHHGHEDSGTHNGSHILPHTRDDQTVLQQSGRSISSPGRYVISSGVIQREGTSPLHGHSLSDGSFSGVVGNGQKLDGEKISSSSAEDRSAHSGERSLETFDHSSLLPSMEEFSGVNQQLSQSHSRTNSVFNAVSNSGDACEVSEASSHMRAYSSYPSEEVKSDSQAASTFNNLQRETESPSRFTARSWSQTTGRWQSERFVPRIVSYSAVETRADLSGVEAQVHKLVEDLKSPSVETQREATAELRLLAKHNMDNRIVIANCGAISLLVNLLHSADITTQENAVTALLNLSINDNNKSAIAAVDAIVPLIHVLQRGSPEARENSAATLFSLSVIEGNKIKIGRSGAIGPLVDLLGNGTPRGKKDAATALFNLSIHHENKPRIVQVGAVKHLVELMDPAAGMVDKAVAVLANLATIPEGRTAIAQEGGIPVLVEVVELGSARGKENAAAALLQLCTNSNRYCNMVLQEGAIPPLVALSQSGTPRAKEKALTLLSYFRTQRHSNGVRP